MEQTRWLSPEEQRTWRRFAAVFTLIPATLDAQLQRESQLTHFNYWVLAMLSEAPDRAMRLSELAAMAHGTQSRLSHAIAKLERDDLVRRERSTEDGRGFVAILTETGYAKLVASAPGHVEQARALVFDALTPEQVGQLDDICVALLTRHTAHT